MKNIKNVNRMLARGHATVIKDLSVRVPSCGRALSDQFSKAPLIARELKKPEGKANLRRTDQSGK